MLDILELAEKIRTKQISEDSPQYKNLHECLVELAGTEEGKETLAEVIGIYLYENAHRFDIAPLITENRHFNLGDRPEFRLKKKGIKAYWLAPNSYTPKTRNYQETLQMEFESLSVRPECLIDDIRAGRVTSFLDLLKDAQEAIRDAIVEKVFTILGQVYNATSNKEMFAVDTTNLTKETLEKAIDTVVYKTGARPVIIGDQLLTNQIMGFEGFTEEANEEMRKTGSIGLFRGARIIGVREVKNEATGQLIVPKNRLYVISKKIGYSATYGEPKTGQETSIDDWTWNARIDKEWGMVVTNPEGMFVIEVQ